MKNKSPKLRLPNPSELAQLAAILRPNSEPETALQTAMQFYVEAVCFSLELPSTIEELVNEFGSKELRREIRRIRSEDRFTKVWADRLTLDPTKDDDPVRQYLAEKGLSLKLAQSVLKNFLRSCNSSTKDTSILRRYADSMIAKCERVSDGRKTYAIPKFMLDEIVEHTKARRKESKRKAWAKSKSRKNAAVKNAEAKS